MKIGDKVVCVDDSPCICGQQIGLIKNNVYVVEACGEQNGRSVFYLLGWQASCKDNPIHRDSRKNTARATRFRSLDEMKLEAKNKSSVDKAIGLQQISDVDL